MLWRTYNTKLVSQVIAEAIDAALVETEEVE
jgi:hypothetical protein